MDDRWTMPGPTGEDRLEALRPPRQDRVAAPGRAPQRRFTFSREVILGVILLLVGGAVAVVVMGKSSAVQQVAVTEADASAATTVPGALASGQAYFAAFVETGAYPPRLSGGDSVIVVVTPVSSADGTTRMLQDVVKVVSVEDAQSVTSGAVVTLLGPESTVRDIADAGSVHLAIVGSAE